jgi:hypothetical protein
VRTSVVVQHSASIAKIDAPPRRTSRGASSKRSAQGALEQRDLAIARAEQAERDRDQALAQASDAQRAQARALGRD